MYPKSEILLIIVTGGSTRMECFYLKKAWNALIFWDTDIELLDTGTPHFKVDV